MITDSHNSMNAADEIIMVTYMRRSSSGFILQNSRVLRYKKSMADGRSVWIRRRPSVVQAKLRV